MSTEAKEKNYPGVKFFPNNPLLSQLQAANNALVGSYLTAADVRAMKETAKGFDQEQFLIPLIKERGILDPGKYCTEYKVPRLPELHDALTTLKISKENFQYRKNDLPFFIAFNNNQPQVFARCIQASDDSKFSNYFTEALSNLALENAVNIIRDYVDHNLINRTQYFNIKKVWEDILGEANRRWKKNEEENRIKCDDLGLGMCFLFLFGGAGMYPFIEFVGDYYKALPNPLDYFLEMFSALTVFIISAGIGFSLLWGAISLYESLRVKWQMHSSDDLRSLYNAAHPESAQGEVEQEETALALS